MNLYHKEELALTRAPTSPNYKLKAISLEPIVALIRILASSDGMVCYVTPWCGIPHEMVWYGIVIYRMVWYRMVYGMVWYDVQL